VLVNSDKLSEFYFVKLRVMKWLTISILLFLFHSFCFAQIGKVGINTTLPEAMLTVRDSSVLFTGPLNPQNTPGAPPVSGGGTRMMWYPNRAAFRAGNVSSTEWNQNNIGVYSFAGGWNTKASGLASTAFGDGANASGLGATAFGPSTASGIYSLALGNFTIASGNMSVTMGEFTRAPGGASVSMGIQTIAKPYASFVIGRYNDTTSISSLAWNDADPLFIIGNGTASNIRSNAMTVLKNGKVGINTTLPTAQLEVKDSSVVFTGLNPLPVTPGSPPVSGAGTRMMWYPDKAAFRTGQVSGLHWNKDSVGIASFAAGFNCKAKGFGSVALGGSNTASSSYCIALGVNSIADDYGCVAIGISSSALGYQSCAFGTSNYATGSTSTAIGSQSKAIGFGSLAAGIATRASGDFSTCLGWQTKSKSYVGTVIGCFNDTTSFGSATSFSPANRLFLIGN
jgi:hypothetical protein